MASTFKTVTTLRSGNFTDGKLKLSVLISSDSYSSLDWLEAWTSGRIAVSVTGLSEEVTELSSFDRRRKKRKPETNPVDTLDEGLFNDVVETNTATAAWQEICRLPALPQGSATYSEGRYEDSEGVQTGVKVRLEIVGQEKISDVIREALMIAVDGKQAPPLNDRLSQLSRDLERRTLVGVAAGNGDLAEESGLDGKLVSLADIGSILNEYPALLRLYGLIIDYDVTLSAGSTEVKTEIKIEGEAVSCDALATHIEIQGDRVRLADNATSVDVLFSTNNDCVLAEKLHTCQWEPEATIRNLLTQGSGDVSSSEALKEPRPVNAGMVVSWSSTAKFGESYLKAAQEPDRKDLYREHLLASLVPTIKAKDGKWHSLTARKVTWTLASGETISWEDEAPIVSSHMSGLQPVAGWIERNRDASRREFTLRTPFGPVSVRVGDEAQFKRINARLGRNDGDYVTFFGVWQGKTFVSDGERDPIIDYGISGVLEGMPDRGKWHRIDVRNDGNDLAHAYMSIGESKDRDLSKLTNGERFSARGEPALAIVKADATPRRVQVDEWLRLSYVGRRDEVLEFSLAMEGLSEAVRAAAETVELNVTPTTIYRLLAPPKDGSSFLESLVVGAIYQVQAIPTPNKDQAETFVIQEIREEDPGEDATIEEISGSGSATEVRLLLMSGRVILARVDPDKTKVREAGTTKERSWRTGGLRILPPASCRVRFDTKPEKRQQGAAKPIILAITPSGEKREPIIGKCVEVVADESHIAVQFEIEEVGSLLVDRETKVIRVGYSYDASVANTGTRLIAQGGLGGLICGSAHVAFRLRKGTNDRIVDEIMIGRGDEKIPEEWVEKRGPWTQGTVCAAETQEDESLEIKLFKKRRVGVDRLTEILHESDVADRKEIAALPLLGDGAAGIQAPFEVEVYLRPSRGDDEFADRIIVKPSAQFEIVNRTNLGGVVQVLSWPANAVGSDPTAVEVLQMEPIHFNVPSNSEQNNRGASLPLAPSESDVTTLILDEKDSSGGPRSADGLMLQAASKAHLPVRLVDAREAIVVNDARSFSAEWMVSENVEGKGHSANTTYQAVVDDMIFAWQGGSLSVPGKSHCFVPEQTLVDVAKWYGVDPWHLIHANRQQLRRIKTVADIVSVRGRGEEIEIPAERSLRRALVPHDPAMLAKVSNDAWNLIKAFNQNDPAGEPLLEAGSEVFLPYESMAHFEMYFENARDKLDIRVSTLTDKEKKAVNGAIVAPPIYKVGDAYTILLRTMDIAGNICPIPENRDDFVELTFRPFGKNPESNKLLRMDPVAPPVVWQSDPAVPLAQKWSEPLNRLAELSAENTVRMPDAAEIDRSTRCFVGEVVLRTDRAELLKEPLANGEVARPRMVDRVELSILPPPVEWSLYKTLETVKSSDACSEYECLRDKKHWRAVIDYLAGIQKSDAGLWQKELEEIKKSPKRRLSGVDFKRFRKDLDRLLREALQDVFDKDLRDPDVEQILFQLPQGCRPPKGPESSEIVIGHRKSSPITMVLSADRALQPINDPRDNAFGKRAKDSPVNDSVIAVAEDCDAEILIRGMPKDGSGNEFYRVYFATTDEKDAKEGALKEAQNDALLGMLTPRRIRIRHVTNQPAKAPDLIRMNMGTRYPLTTEALFDVRFQIHRPSTGSLVIQSATEREYVDSREGDLPGVPLEELYRIIEESEFREDIKKQLVSEHKAFAQLREHGVRSATEGVSKAQPAVYYGRTSDLTTNLCGRTVDLGLIDVKTPASITQLPLIEELDAKPRATNPERETQKLFRQATKDEENFRFVVDLQDTRHRTMFVRGVGISRYGKEQFGEQYTETNPKTLRNPQEPEHSDKWVRLELPATKKPDDPIVADVTVVLEWSDGLGSPEVAWRRGQGSNWFFSRERRAGHRVWLERPWYSSGSGEKLAVVLWSDPNVMEDTGEEYIRLVSRWGTDPVFENDTDFRSGLLTRKDFVNTWSSAMGLNTRANRPAEEPDVTPVADGSAKADAVQYVTESGDALSVAMVAYEPKFHLEEKKWYCDIFAEPKSYMPFVSYSVARYQPCSLADCALSSAIRLKPLQILPRRTLSVMAYYDSSIVLRIKLSGIFPPQNSREIAVTVERNRFVDAMAGGDEQAWNMDLGWERVSILDDKGSAVREVVDRDPAPSLRGHPDQGYESREVSIIVKVPDLSPVSFSDPLHADGDPRPLAHARSLRVNVCEYEILPIARPMTEGFRERRRIVYSDQFLLPRELMAIVPMMVQATGASSKRRN